VLSFLLLLLALPSHCPAVRLMLYYKGLVLDSCIIAHPSVSYICKRMMRCLAQFLPSLRRLCYQVKMVFERGCFPGRWAFACVADYIFGLFILSTMLA